MYLYRHFSSQEEIDREYDVEAAVPDFGHYADFYIGESARARQVLPCALDVRFGPTLAEHMDIFPAATPGAPVLVFVHGGYWRILGAKEFSFVARGLHARGFTVVVTNYALAPAVTVSEITRQGRAAIARLPKIIAAHNGDPDRIFVAGHSAGGQQSAMLALTDWAGLYGLPADLIKGAIPISGLFDLTPLAFSWLAPTLRLDLHQLRAQSPLFQIPHGGTPPPLLVTVGGAETDEFRRQSDDFLAAWTGAGHRGEAFAQPGRNHFTAITDLADADGPLTVAIAAFAEAIAPARRPAARASDAGQKTGTPDTTRPALPADTKAADRRAWQTGPATQRFPTFGAPRPVLDYEKGKK